MLINLIPLNISIINHSTEYGNHCSFRNLMLVLWQADLAKWKSCTKLVRETVAHMSKAYYCFLEDKAAEIDSAAERGC